MEDQQKPILPDRRCLCYNVGGIGYDHGIPDRQTHQQLGIRRLTGKQYDGQGRGSSPSVRPSEEELAETSTLPTVLWVGMMPVEAPKYRTKANKSKATPANAALAKSNRGKSIAEGTLTILDHDPKALRVGVSLKVEKSVAFYVLIDQQDGLCETALIDLEEVFYFEEFRDDTLTAVEHRRKQWNALIRTHVHSSRDADAKPEITFSRSLAATRITVPPQISAAHELQSRAAAYLATGSAQHLEQMIQLLQDIDPDLSYRPRAGNEVLVKLLDLNKDFTLHDADLAAERCRILWPELTTMLVEGLPLLGLAYALRDANLVVEYRLLRALIIEWVSQYDGSTEPNVTTVVAHLRLLLGTSTGTVSLAQDQTLALLHSLLSHLHAIRAYGEKHTSALKSSQGGRLTGQSYEAIAERFAKSPDVDSAIVWMQQLRLFDHNELMLKNTTMEGQLKRLCSWLEELLEQMKQV